MNSARALKTLNGPAKSVLAVLSTVLLTVPTLTADIAEPGCERPRIALIIDDLGYSRSQAERAIALPGPVAFAVLPQAPYSSRLAQLAHERGKEVLLHLPMQALDGDRLGPGAITLDTTRAELERILSANLVTVPNAVGISSHMGSLVTQHPGHMSWLMEAIDARGSLYFIDSYTTKASVALRLAREFGIPSIRRDVFLDRDLEQGTIDTQFERLISLALKRGTALGIGHPYPVTIGVLERRLPRLVEDGIELVSVEELIRVELEGEASWQAYSYR